MERPYPESGHGRESSEAHAVLEARLAREKIRLDGVEVHAKAHEIEFSGLLETESAALPTVKIEAASLGKAEKNQDAIFVYTKPGANFFCTGIMDGVGGQRGGYEASHILKDELSSALSGLRDEEVAYRTILQAIQQATEKFRARLDAMGDEFKDADTTMSLVFGLPHEGNTRVATVSVGDSPIYLRTERQTLQKLTIDDGPVDRMRHEGSLSSLEAKVHPRKNEIFYSARHPVPHLNAAAAGLPNFPYEVGEYDLVGSNGEVELLIASDGLTDQFREDPTYNELEKMVCNLKYTPAEMVAAAKLRSEQGIEGLSKNDDVSVVRIQIGDGKVNSAERIEQKGESEPAVNPGIAAVSAVEADPLTPDEVKHALKDSKNSKEAAAAVDNKVTFGGKVKNFFKNNGAGGFVGGIAASVGLKFLAMRFLDVGGVGAGAIAGGAVGGGVEFLRSNRAENRRLVDLETYNRALDGYEDMSDFEKVQAFIAVDSALGNKKLDPSTHVELAAKLTHLSVLINQRESWENTDGAEKIKQLLKLRGAADGDILTKEQSGESKKLLEQLQKEKGLTKNRKKIAMQTAKGVVTGAAGGALGAWIFGHIFSGAHSAAGHGGAGSHHVGTHHAPGSHPTESHSVEAPVAPEVGAGDIQHMDQNVWHTVKEFMVHQGHVAHPSNADVNQAMVEIAKANGVEISGHHLADPNHAGHLAGELQKFLDTKMQQGTPLHGFDSLKGIIEHAGGHVDASHAAYTSHVPTEPSMHEVANTVMGKLELQRAAAHHDHNLSKIVAYALGGGTLAAAGTYGAVKIRQSSKRRKNEQAQAETSGEHDSVGNKLRKPGESAAEASVATETSESGILKEEQEDASPREVAQAIEAEKIETMSEDSDQSFIDGVGDIRDMVSRGQRELDGGDDTAARSSLEEASDMLKKLAQIAASFGGHDKELALSAITTLAATVGSLRKKILGTSANVSTGTDLAPAANEEEPKDFGIEQWKVPFYRKAVELGILPKLVDYNELGLRRKASLDTFIMFTQENESVLEQIYGKEDTTKIRKQFLAALAGLNKSNRKPFREFCTTVLRDSDASGKLPVAKRMLKEMGKITSRKESVSGLVLEAIKNYKESKTKE